MTSLAQSSTVSGLRAEKFGDIVFIDHADVQIRGETSTVLIVVDGATNCVTAFAQRTKERHEPRQ